MIFISYLATPPKITLLQKKQILSSLKEKAAARELQVERESMRNPEIMRRSQADYHSLESETEGKLPPLDEVYETVMTYYEGASLEQLGRCQWQSGQSFSQQGQAV